MKKEGQELMRRRQMSELVLEGGSPEAGPNGRPDLAHSYWFFEEVSEQSFQLHQAQSSRS